MAKKDDEWRGIVQNDGLDLALRVETWLKNSGYPLEYRTAQALWAHDFNVQQGTYLPADEDRNGMEVDLIGTYAPADYRPAAFQLLIECKVIPKPKIWVAMEDPEPLPQGIERGLGVSAVTQFLEQQQREPRFERHGMPLVEASVATCVRTVLDSGIGDREDEKGSDRTTAFSAVTQLVRRAISQLRQHDERSEDDQHSVAMVVPLLVVEGDVAVARWDHEKRSFTAKPIDHIWVSWGGHQGWLLPWFTFALVKVDALDAFLAPVSKWAREWMLAGWASSELSLPLIRGQDSAGQPRRDLIAANKAYRR